jgi:hypothetical protein
MSSRKYRQIYFFAAALIFTAIIAYFSWILGRSGAYPLNRWETWIFRGYVLKPIPQSVADIKLDELKTSPFGRRHGYVMRFKISKADIELILKSRVFEEFEWDRYENDYLHWKGTHKIEFDPNTNTYTSTSTSGSLPLYTNPKQQPPEWFTPNDWDNAKVYKYEQDWGKSDRVHTKILIFNEDLEEAYFVEDL